VGVGGSLVCGWKYVAGVTAFCPALFSRPRRRQNLPTTERLPTAARRAGCEFEPDSGGMEEIVVTARTRSEDIHRAHCNQALTRDD